MDNQVDICRKAEVMVSIHGAGLANMIFMETGSKVLEFRRSKIFHNQCFLHLASALRMKYFYFYGEPDSNKQIEGDGCNLYIPIDRLEREVKNLEIY